MIITRSFAEALIGMEMRKASFVLAQLSETSFDYPETRIEDFLEFYDEMHRIKEK